MRTAWELPWVDRSPGCAFCAEGREPGVAHLVTPERLGFFHVLPGSVAMVVRERGPVPDDHRLPFSFTPVASCSHLVELLGAYRAGTLGFLVRSTTPANVAGHALQASRRSGRVAVMIVPEDALAVGLELAEEADAISVWLDPDRMDAALLRVRMQAIEKLVRAGAWVEVVLPLSASSAARGEEIRSTLRAIASVSPWIPVHLRDPDLEGAFAFASTARGGLLSEGKGDGPRFLYGGDGTRALELTFCPACRDELLIERHAGLVRLHLQEAGRCPRCEHGVPGIFEHSPDASLR